MKAPQIHAARIVEPDETFWFASLDGELWVGVSRDPRLATVAQVQLVFDGNGKFRPMRATRGFLRAQNAEFLKPVAAG